MALAFWAGMKTQRLAMAGTALMGIGAVQLLGALYFCWAGGMDGVLSPVAAVAVVWPVAALLWFLGRRLRRVAV
ncbi:MAG: hypothetical protein JNM66_00470 [Bryobacterales bacterium]|nr:hypothetical protein [Bryobacterales bacterium]